MNQIIYPDDFSNFKIGEKYPVLKADNSITISNAALSLLSQARHSVDIFTHDLESRILDTPEIVAAITGFIKISPKSRLKILLCDPSVPVKKGHRFIELSRKLSSFISIRKTHEEYQTKAFCFMIVDGKAMIFRPYADEYSAIINFDAAYESRQHLEFFNEVWELSEPASELRQLYI